MASKDDSLGKGVEKIMKEQERERVRQDIKNAPKSDPPRTKGRIGR